MKKKTISTILVIVISLFLVACGGDNDNQPSTPSGGTEKPPVDTSTPAPPTP